MWPARDPFQLDDRDGWEVMSYFSRDVFFQGIKQQTKDSYLSPFVKYTAATVIKIRRMQRESLRLFKSLGYFFDFVKSNKIFNYINYMLAAYT